MSIGTFLTILGFDDLKIKNLVIGLRSCTRTTLQKPKGLLITPFKLERYFSVCTVYVGRTASIAGIVYAPNLCATIRET